MKNSARNRVPSQPDFSLPDIEAKHFVAWRIARRIVPATIALFAALLLASIFVAFVVTFETTVDGTGTLEPSTVWIVRSTESGIVSEIRVRAGDFVSRGQFVARLDGTVQQETIAALEAQYQIAHLELDRLVLATPIERARLRAFVLSADAGVRRARLALQERMADFGVQGPIDSVVAASSSRVHVQLDMAVANLIGSQADSNAATEALREGELLILDITQKRRSLQRLKTQLEAERKRLRSLAIVAPISGVVLTNGLEHSVGSMVAPGQSLLELADLTSWRAEINIQESDVHKVRVGEQATIEVPALIGFSVDQFRGRVIAVALENEGADGRVASAPRQSSEYRVQIAIDEPDLTASKSRAFRRGYLVRAKILTGSGTIAVLVRNHLRKRSRSFGSL